MPAWIRVICFLIKGEELRNGKQVHLLLQERQKYGSEFFADCFTQL